MPAFPALGDAQVRKLLDAMPEDTLKRGRDRAILAILLYHGLRCEELCRLRRDVQNRQGHDAFPGARQRSRRASVPSRR